MTHAYFRPLLVLFSVMTLLTGFLYPLLVTGLGVAIFPEQVAGSLIESNGKIVGSELVGQAFSSPRYFWSRPSATAPMPYNASASSGSNLGPLNPAQIEAVRSRADALRTSDPGNTKSIPVDLVTASASGLDPHISIASAKYQAARVARMRGMELSAIDELIDKHSERRIFGFLGESRVNVLKLNLALDDYQKN